MDGCHWSYKVEWAIIKTKNMFYFTSHWLEFRLKKKILLSSQYFSLDMFQNVIQYRPLPSEEKNNLTHLHTKCIETMYNFVCRDTITQSFRKTSENVNLKMLKRSPFHCNRTFRLPIYKNLGRQIVSHSSMPGSVFSLWCCLRDWVECTRHTAFIYQQWQ